MNRRTFLATGVSAALTISGCFGSEDKPLPVTPSGAWSQRAYDSSNTAHTGSSVPERGNIAWTSDAFTRWQPVVADGCVYIGRVEGNPRLTALDARDGSEVWSTELESTTVDLPENVEINLSENTDIPSDEREIFASYYTSAVVGERLVVAYGPWLAAFDTATGETMWERQWETDFTLTSMSMTVAPDGSTVVAPHPDGVVAFDADTGTTHWKGDLSALTVGAPAVYGDSVYIAHGTTLERRRLSNGERVWELTFEDDLPAGPVTTDSGVLLAGDGHLSRYDHDSGDRLANLAEYERDVYGIAAGDETVFFLTFWDFVVISADDGHTRWNLNTAPGRYETRVRGRARGLCIGEETVVTPLSYDELDSGTSWPSIAAFDRQTGEPQWHYSIDGFGPSFTSPPILVDSAVYFTANTIDGVGALGDVSRE
jgi:outer membrane protein assembly factor BamB